MTTASHNIKVVPGIIVIVSCHAHLGTRLANRNLNLYEQKYASWPVWYVLGNPSLEEEWTTWYHSGRNHNYLVLCCEDSYIHLLKKVGLALRALGKMYDVQEGFLRCGDDLVWYQQRLTQYLTSTMKGDYVGVNNPNANPDRATKKKKIDNWMFDYFKDHREAFGNEKNGLQDVTLDNIAAMNVAPTVLTNVGVLVFYSVRAARAVVAHMDLIEWDIFREERDYGFRYTIEDVGIASILEQAGFPAQFRRFWTNTMSTFRKDADCFVLHTNAGK